MLRNEFRKDPRLPILIGDGNFIALVRKGIDDRRLRLQGGDLLLGKGDPWADIKIDDNALVYTTVYARSRACGPGRRRRRPAGHRERHRAWAFLPRRRRPLRRHRRESRPSRPKRR